MREAALAERAAWEVRANTMWLTQLVLIDPNLSSHPNALGRPDDLQFLSSAHKKIRT